MILQKGALRLILSGKKLDHTAPIAQSLLFIAEIEIEIEIEYFRT